MSPLVVPPSWDAAIGSIIPPLDVHENVLVEQGSTYLVSGPKNAGKSTFARLLLNRLLSRYDDVPVHWPSISFKHAGSGAWPTSNATSVNQSLPQAVWSA